MLGPHGRRASRESDGGECGAKAPLEGKGRFDRRSTLPHVVRPWPLKPEGFFEANSQ